MRKVLWGVRRGGVVVRCFDGEAAFREEAALRFYGGWEDAVAVVSRDGVAWVAVPPGSTVRPDPRHPRRPTRKPLESGRVHRWAKTCLRRLGFGSAPDSVRVGPVFRRWLR